MLQAVAALLMQLQARIDAEEQTLHHAVHDELTGLPIDRRCSLNWRGGWTKTKRRRFSFLTLTDSR